MPKFPQNAIVKHVSGDIRGYVMNIFEQQDGSPPYYFIQWDDGTPLISPGERASMGHNGTSSDA